MAANEPPSLSDTDIFRQKGNRNLQRQDDPVSTHPAADRPSEVGGELRMKSRQTSRMSALNVRVPELIASGGRLMAFMERRQLQEIVAEAIEEKLDRWNPRWREAAAE